MTKDNSSKKIISRKLIKAIEIFSLVIAFMSGLMMVISWTVAKSGAPYRRPFFAVIYYFSDISLLFFLFVWVYTCIYLHDLELLKQSTIVTVMTGTVITLNKIKDIIHEKENLLFHCSLLISGLLLLIYSFIMIRVIIKRPRVKMLSVTKEKLALAIVLLFAALIPIAEYRSFQRWDPSLFHNSLYGYRPDGILNLFTMSWASHTDQLFTSINYSISRLTGDVYLGCAICQIFLYLYSVYSVYRILKIFLRDTNGVYIAILSAAYAVSPFTLGFANYYFYDAWCIYLLPIIAYTYLYKKWIYHFIFALILCFSKETGVVSYCGFCVGALLYEVSICHINIFKEKKYFGMLIVGFTWLMIYMIGPKWGDFGISLRIGSDDNANVDSISASNAGTAGISVNSLSGSVIGHFGLDIPDFLNKLKVLFVLNFNWILLIFAILAILFVCRKKIKNELVLPLIISDVFFIFFNAVFNTVNHPRYINTHVGCLYILALLGVGMISKTVISYTITGILVLLLGISSFRTIDPITLNVFESHDVGDTKMINTEILMTDSMVYNRQYLGIDKTINMALSDLAGENCNLFFPEVRKDLAWEYDGLNYMIPEGYVLTEYWDTKYKMRSIEETKNGVPIGIQYISSAEQIKGDRNYLFSFQFAGQDILSSLRQTDRIKEEKEYQSGGIILTCALVE